MSTIFPNVSYGINQTPSGPWMEGGTEGRCPLILSGSPPTILLGVSNFQAPSYDTAGAQILAQYSPMSGAWEIEAQLEPAQIAISSMVERNFGGGVYLTCAGR
jgi:hypothetical protein